MASVSFFAAFLFHDVAAPARAQHALGVERFVVPGKGSASVRAGLRLNPPKSMILPAVKPVTEAVRRSCHVNFYEPEIKLWQKCWKTPPPACHWLPNTNHFLPRRKHVLTIYSGKIGVVAARFCFPMLAMPRPKSDNPLHKMPPAPLEQIIPELRDAIGPMILISGVGLLLLTMTNRLGRAIDRARQLKHELSIRTGREHQQTLAQVTIIYRRAKIVRLSITLAATSAALAAVLIMTLFVTALFQLPEGFLIGLIFVACMASLLASLIAFICDINLSLHALKLELEGIAPEAGKSGGK
jgi:hypothetical protein